ncbi:TonB-dependent receptor domain-containing protein [Dyadobacter crusticola]|uniref:TonB-dependent receptor domain-containing protein n=1 Tax=Dyadobacter crusticola TaxID=292407 RepID=UPI0004E21309|nr:TonB-dependent receptor [Dyadobacter crusticola]
MKRKSYLIAAFVMSLSGHLSAQFLVKGKVVEKNSAVAPYATVALVAGKDSSIVKGAMCDDQGLFAIDNIAEGDYLVTVQYMGFQKKWSERFTLNAANPAQEFSGIALEETAQDLREITVKGQRSLVEQKGDRMILNVENSVIAKGNKVEDLLKYAPLVRTSSNGIKVGNKGNVLILVDGRQTSESALSNFLQNFSAEEILKVEVMSNPPAKYDASFGAVINIITKKSLSTGLNGRLSVIHSQGQMGRFYPDGSLNFRTPKWNFFTSVSGKVENTLEDQVLERKFPGGAMKNELEVIYRTKGVSTFSGIDFTPNDRQSVGLRFNTGHSRSRYLTDMETRFIGASGKVDSLLHVDKNRRGNSETYDVNLYYTGKLDSTGKELSVNVTQSFLDKSNVQNLYYQRQDAEGGAIGTTTAVKIQNPGDQRSLIAQADLTLPSKAGRWELGGRYMSISNNNQLMQETATEGFYVLDPAFSNSGVYKEFGYAGYGNYTNDLKGGWSVQAGVRFEYTSQELASSNLNRRYSGFFPSLGITKEFDNKSNFNISYTRKISRPALSNLVPYRSLMDPYTISESNPALKPSFANTLDVYYTMGGLSFYANYTHTKNLISDVMFADLETRIYIQSMGNLKSVNDAYVGANWGQEVVKWWQTNTSLTISGTQTRSEIGNVPGVKLGGYGFSFYSTNIFSLPKGYKTELFFAYNSPNRYTIWQNRALYWATVSLTKEVVKDVTFKVSFQDIFRTQVNTLLTEYGPVNISSRYYSDNQRVRASLSYNFGKKTVKQARNKSLGNEAEKRRMNAN